MNFDTDEEIVQIQDIETYCELLKVRLTELREVFRVYPSQKLDMDSLREMKVALSKTIEEADGMIEMDRES